MNIGVLGFGTVASATIKNFEKNKSLIILKTNNKNIRITHVATRTPKKAEGKLPDGCVLSNDCIALVGNPSIDVIIELIGNVEFSKELIIKALESGKHVITANKAVLSKYGNELFKCAEVNNKRLLFEGAVAVSIPVSKIIRESLAANNIMSIKGILNGTSNYILTKMEDSQINFEEALIKAQNKGYAEASPTLDINGMDAAHKLSILNALVFRSVINLNDIYIRGIEDIQLSDILYTKKFGYKIKLIAQSRLIKKNLVLSVSPTLVPIENFLSKVTGSMNGLYLNGDLMGEAFFYGSGAGGDETSSAILSDLIDISSGSKSYNLGCSSSELLNFKITNIYEVSSQFYIRFSVPDLLAISLTITKCLNNLSISVDRVEQIRINDLIDICIITNITTEKKIKLLISNMHAFIKSIHVEYFPILTI